MREFLENKDCVFLYLNPCCLSPSTWQEGGTQAIFTEANSLDRYTLDTSTDKSCLSFRTAAKQPRPILASVKGFGSNSSHTQPRRGSHQAPHSK